MLFATLPLSFTFHISKQAPPIYCWNVIHLHARLCHLFLSSLSFFLRSNISSGRSIRFVLSKSCFFHFLFNFSIMSSFSESNLAWRSDLLTSPLDLSRSMFFPSTALFNTREAPTLNKRNGSPAFTKRWKLEGCCICEDAFLTPAAVGRNLYCSWNDFSDDDGVDFGSLILSDVAPIISTEISWVLGAILNLYRTTSRYNTI